MLLKIICTLLIIKGYIILSECVSKEEPRADLDRLGKPSIKSSNLSIRLYGSNCAEATVNTMASGIYEILIPSYSEHPFKVTCDTKTQGGGWTVILSRMDGSVDFFRNWNTYKKGFGDLDGEFFLGLDKIHALTAEFSQELLVLLEDNKGVEAFELYEKFAIADEDEMYALHILGKASGTAGDSLRGHHTMKFSTFDRENGLNPDMKCARDLTGAWWYHKCHESHLTGKYGDNTFGKGVNWIHFRGYENSLKRAVMMIRPRKLTVSLC